MMRSWQPKILVIIPCYNEEKAIENVVRDVLAVRDEYGYRLHVLVVNDCSTDRSLVVIRQLPCLCLDLPVNLGIGGAMHSGYKFADRNGYDIAVQLDGDGQHPAGELPNVLGPIIQRRADVVIGSRFLERQGFQSSFFRRFGIAYFSRLNKLLIGQVIYDSTSGYRAFSRSAIELASQYYPDEYPEPEAIVQFGLSNLKIMEVPVVMRERQGGVSSINTSRAVYYMAKVSLGVFFMYLRLRGKQTLSLR